MKPRMQRALVMGGLLTIFAIGLISRLVFGQGSPGNGSGTTIYIPLVRNGSSAPPVGGNPHSQITSYAGPQTCVACHAEEANGALHSEHMQWKGKWDAVNTYCTAPAPAEYACLNCHASTGKVKNLTVNDVDCLVCHQDQYKRSLGPLTVDVTVVDWQGMTKVYHTPQQTADGQYQFQPRYDLMPPGTTMEKLAQTVHLPTRTTCLGCHAKAGGGDGVKRGDLSTISANPPLTSDVHLSPQGGNLLCQDCHVPTNHQIPGKGIDLRISEGGQVKACAACHQSDVSGHSTNLSNHMGRVACQSCHIPEYAKDVPTEMSRDWRAPHWNPTACNGQGAWVGEEVKQGNVTPQYVFWNGSSYVYSLADSLNADPNGMFSMARAFGNIQDGKIFPIKVHTAWQPRSTVTGQMVQYDVRWNFMTGFFEEAAQRGLQYMGLAPIDSNGQKTYAWVQARAEQLITHGVEPADNALGCADCHGGTRINFQALGYGVKQPLSTTCTQCHENESNPGFTKVHDIHVKDENRGCQWCHNFSRPERGLN